MNQQRGYASLAGVDMLIDECNAEARRLSEFECKSDDAHKARGAGIYRNIETICNYKKRPHPNLGGWRDITYRTLSAKLTDYTSDAELSIRFLFWLALHWDTLYEVRQVPQDFHVKYYRIPEVYGKFLCDVPDIVFTGSLLAGPIRNPDLAKLDTLGYTPTYRESEYATEDTVPFWSHEVYDKFKDKLDWTHQLNDDHGCDTWIGCEPWLDIEFDLPTQDQIRSHALESTKRFRQALLDKEDQA